MMLIGELSKRTGLSRDTLRFYEKIGIINATSKRPANTQYYKDYAEETVERLALVIQGKTLGFTLNEMKQLINQWPENDIPFSEQFKVVEKKLEETTQRIEQLTEIQAYLSKKLETLKQNMKMMSDRE